MTTLRRFEPHPPAELDRLRGLPLASFPRRGVALTIDFLIAGISLAALGYLGLKLVLALGLLDASGNEHYDVKINFFGNWYSIAGLVLFLGISNHLGNGRTLGKRLLGIRAVSLVRPELRGWPAFERVLAYGASALELGFGFIQYFLHPNRQTVHDRIAETIVVDERGPR